jgi:hypothetical protein
MRFRHEDTFANLRPGPESGKGRPAYSGDGSLPGMVGRTYLERGRPVVVVARWLGTGTPRNVLIRREGGHLVVRPFRGLRRIAP